jgi:ankyrin repeat protein
LNPIKREESESQVIFCKILLENGIGIDYSFQGGNTFLIHAILRNESHFSEEERRWYNNIIQFFVEKGADVNKKNESGSAPIHFVDTVEVLEILLKSKLHIDFKAKNNFGDTALHNACRNENVKLITLLLKHDPSVILTRNNNNEKPIDLVKNPVLKHLLNQVENKHQEMLSLLIQDLNNEEVSTKFTSIHPARARSASLVY